MKLVDGKGNCYVAEVNKDNQLSTFSITETEFEFVSKEKGLAFSWASGTYDPDAGDTVLLVKNTSSTKNLHIDTITISTDTETRAVIHVPTADVTVAGTTITGVNLNLTNSNVAEASAARDETGNTQGNVVWSGEVQANSDPFLVDFAGALILGANNSVGVDFVSATTACDVTITGHYQ
jgi:uncharacterized protein YjbI with pentapeptide repeats